MELVWGRQNDESSVRITSARRSREEDLAMRQRRYLISMAVRVLCFVGAIVVGPGWLRWVLVLGSVVLPYLAVVLANAADQRHDAFLPETPDFWDRQLPPAGRS